MTPKVTADLSRGGRAPETTPAPSSGSLAHSGVFRHEDRLRHLTHREVRYVHCEPVGKGVKDIPGRKPPIAFVLGIKLIIRCGTFGMNGADKVDIKPGLPDQVPKASDTTRVCYSPL